MSLVCDIVEPFRCIIDRRVRKAHNLGQIDDSDFSKKNGMVELGYSGREKYTRLFLKDILEKKTEIFRFCQSYYRWFSGKKSILEFPKFSIGEICI